MDTTQVNNMLTSEKTLSALMTLIAVVVGGLISLITGIIVERRREERERKSEIIKIKCQAIEAAMGWYLPLFKYVTAATSCTNAYLYGRLTWEEVEKRYPKDDLPPITDPPSAQQIFIKDAYRRAFRISRNVCDLFSEIASLPLNMSVSKDDIPEPMRGLVELPTADEINARKKKCLDMSIKLDEDVNEFWEEMKTNYINSVGFGLKDDVIRSLVGNLD